MSEAVEQVIIGPMLALYPPPQHLRGDGKRQAAALAVYRRTLEPFDRAVLAAGWEKVTANHPFWVWPNPGLIVEACRQCLPPPPAVSENQRRRERAIEMTDAYTARFMKTTHLARLGREEGWAPQLMEYVREAAWVQAQLINGVKPVGFSSVLIPATQRGGSAAEFFTAYCKTIEGPVERARIRVTVLPSLILRWKMPGVAAETATPGNHDYGCGRGRC